jgi:hypothetical protein
VIARPHTWANQDGELRWCACDAGWSSKFRLALANAAIVRR